MVYYLFQTMNKKSFRVEKGLDVTIGRAFDNSLRIENSSISRYHARITWRGEMLVVSDLASTNGVFVNGNAVETDSFVPLKPGDELKIGSLKMILLDEKTFASQKSDNPKNINTSLILDFELTQEFLSHKN